MVREIERSYERIANSIIASIPEEWSHAGVMAVFYSDGISWLPEYQTPTGQTRAFDISVELTRAFQELRRKFQDSGKPVWGAACFEMQPDGQFEVRWGYDNCDVNGDTIWDETEWKRMQDEYQRRQSPP